MKERFTDKVSEPLKWCRFNSGAAPCFADRTGTASFIKGDLRSEAEHVKDRHPVEWFFIANGGAVPM